MKVLRKPQYTPGTQGDNLREFIRNELERVNNATESGWTHEVLEKLTQEPTRKRVGMKVYADGSLWNPGSGEGVYVLTSSGWQKLG